MHLYQPTKYVLCIIIPSDNAHLLGRYKLISLATQCLMYGMMHDTHLVGSFRVDKVRLTFHPPSATLKIFVCLH